MALRSRLLVHWTGKDIGVDPNRLEAADRVAYLGRLVALLERGFWMTTPHESLRGSNGCAIEYQTPMTCFTEIRLSQARNHAARYGLLGVAVDRRWVLDRWGGPVHYVRGDAPELLVRNTAHIMKYLQDRGAAGDAAAGDVERWFNVLISYMKRMSEQADDMCLLEEQEWRVVQIDELTQNGTQLPGHGERSPPFLMPIAPDDVQALIFPDARAADEARADARFQTWLRGRKRDPVVLSLDICENL